MSSGSPTCYARHPVYNLEQLRKKKKVMPDIVNVCGNTKVATPVTNELKTITTCYGVRVQPRRPAFPVGES